VRPYTQLVALSAIVADFVSKIKKKKKLNDMVISHTFHSTLNMCHKNNTKRMVGQYFFLDEYHISFTF
jgi:hypothetical protein